MLTMAFQCLDLNAQKLEDLCEETVHVCTLYKGALLELLLIIYIYIFCSFPMIDLEREFTRKIGHL